MNSVTWMWTFCFPLWLDQFRCSRMFYIKFLNVHTLLFTSQTQVLMSMLLLFCWVISFYVSSDRAIPSSNIDLHYAHCSRNLERCKICGDMVPRKYSDEHFLSTHAPVCDFIQEASLTYPWICWQVFFRVPYWWKSYLTSLNVLCRLFSILWAWYFSEKKKMNYVYLWLWYVVRCNPVGVLFLYRSVSYLIDQILFKEGLYQTMNGYTDALDIWWNRANQREYGKVMGFLSLCSQ